LFSQVYSPYPLFAITVFFLFTVHVGGDLPPLSSEANHTLVTVTSLPLSKHTEGGGSTPAFSRQLVYLQFGGGCSSPTLQSSVHTPPFAMCLFFFCFSAACLLFSFFSLFSLGGGQSVQGAMLICPRVVCGIMFAV
jgi:hypothetical protein